MTLDKNTITPMFQLSATKLNEKLLPKTYFIKHMKNFFDTETAGKILESFHRMQIVVPERKNEFMKATEGGIVFLNKYGLVLRIEKKEPTNSGDRVDSAWMLQPIASIDLGAAILEVCPGCFIEKDKKKLMDLHERILDEGLNFSDDQLENVGIIPLKTVDFPDGMSVVIDLLSVEEFGVSITPIKKALAEKARKAQREFYAPLSRAFEEGWADISKMKDFLSLCKEYVTDGKLIAGWNCNSDIYHEPIYEKFGGSKTFLAAKVARNYMRRLKG